MSGVWHRANVGVNTFFFLGLEFQVSLRSVLVGIGSIEKGLQESKLLNTGKEICEQNINYVLCPNGSILTAESAD